MEIEGRVYGFIYLYEIEQRNFCNCFKWVGEVVEG
jgi:hypothetical protein